MRDEIPEGYVRVTDVLKPFTPFATLDPNSSYGRNVIAAADRGTRVHKLCEAYAQDLFVEDCDEDCKNYFDSFKAWFDEMVVQVISTEQRLNSPHYRLSGCVDLVCVLKGDREATLVDIKTPKESSNSWTLQTAAYRILLREVGGLEVDRRTCLMLPRYGIEIKVIDYEEHEEHERLFLNLLEAYRFFER